MASNRESNIFHRVADSEVPFTELFCNFMNFKLFRKCVFRAISNDFNFTDIEYEHFSTQFRLPNQCGQPDILIEHDDVQILIEIKINNSGLTGNQPKGYLSHLKKIKENNLLVFIIPEDYAHREELDLRFQGVAEEKYKIITWKEIINEFTSQEIDNINPLFSEFFTLLSSWFNPYLVCFNSAEVSYMFTSSIPSILEKLFSIVDSVKNATATTCKSTKGQSREYGLNFKNPDGEDILYFGVWYEFWEKHNKPLIYGIHNDYPKNIKEIFLKRNKGKLIELNDWQMTWFDQSDFDEAKNIIKTIHAELDELLKS